MCTQPLTTREGKIFSCGRCKKCHDRYVQHWTFRLQQEQRVTGKSIFLTLTYDYSNVPMYYGKMTLYKKDYQDYLKRVRKELDKQDIKIKYVCCGEYGSNRGRPHYHLLIFGINSDYFNLLQSEWGKGEINIGNVEPASIAYVFKYAVKGSQKTLDWRQQKQFVSMSKGLGESFAFDIQIQKTTHTYIKNTNQDYTTLDKKLKKIEGTNNLKLMYVKNKKYNIADSNCNYQSETKILTRTKKIRLIKPHFKIKLQQLTMQPYYNLPSTKGGTVRMSLPRFYLKAANYDTTELTELYLDEMQNKYASYPPALLEIVLKQAERQQTESINSQVNAIAYSVTKESKEL